MRKREFTVIIERDEEGYFVAEVPELPGCYTQAKSPDTLMTRLAETISLFRMPHPVTTLKDLRGAVPSKGKGDFTAERKRAKTAVAKRVRKDMK
jgi:hypothetical protein